MKTNHHTRQGHEQLLRNVSKEGSGKVWGSMRKMKNIDILHEINDQLILNGCIPFTYDELENILDALD